LRIQQRGGRKSVTTLQGLPEELNLKKILAFLKKEFACSGKVNEEANAIIFAGDQRTKIAEFLIKEKIAKKEDIKIHGF
jgi:translation initiation factor 1